jgi:upstream activation factor subunit UAF30
MAKTTKATKSSDVSSAPVTAPVSVPATTPAPAGEKVVKAKKPKAEKVEVASAPVTPVVPVTDAVTTDDAETPLAEQSIEFLAKLGQISALISGLKAEYRSLEKKWTKELKSAQKQSSKRKRKTGNRPPSGFVKPTKISDELASFLGKDKGSEMARTAVTRDINAYIRENNLQDPTNGRKINPDAKLSALLKLEKADELTYFNLQRFMSPHFAKTVKAEVATA